MTGVLAGREQELAAVGQILTAAGHGSGSAFVVTGPLGSGRSALLHEVREVAESRGFRVLCANGVAVEQDVPLAVVRQMFGWLFAEVPPAGELDGAQLRAALAEPAAAWRAGTENAGLAEALRHWLRELAAGRPLLLLLDDAQWADDASLWLLGYLSRRIAGTHCVLGSSVRDGHPMAARSAVRGLLAGVREVLRPGPLSRADIVAVVRRRFSSPADAFVDACAEVSGGNPLVLAAVLADLEESGTPPDAGGVRAVRDARPAALRQRLAAYVREQPHEAEELLRALDVLAPETAPDLARELARLDPTAFVEHERHLVRQGLLRAGEVPEPVHPCLSDALAGLMSPEDRAALHLRAAELLHDMGRPAEQVARALLALPGTGGRRWATEVLRAAADSAAAGDDPGAAADYLRRALVDAGPTGRERMVLLLELAEVERGVDIGASMRHIVQAAALAPTTREAAAAAARLSLSALSAAPAHVVQLVRDTAACLGPPGECDAADRELALLLEARLRGATDVGAGELDQAVARLGGMDVPEALRSAGGRQLLAVLLHAATLTAGEPVSRITAVARELLDYEPATTEHAYTTLPAMVTVLVATGSTDVLMPWVGRVAAEVDRRELPVVRAMIDAERALVAYAEGRLDEFALRTAAALQVAERSRLVLPVPTLVVLASAATEKQDLALVERLAALGDYHGYGGHLGVSAMRRMRAALRALRTGDLALSLENFQECGRRLDQAGWRNPMLWPWRLWVATVQRELGDRDAAFATAEQHLWLAQRWGAPVPRGRALTLLGTIAGAREGEPLLREAVALLADSGNQLESARAHLALADCLGSGRESQQHRRAGVGQAGLSGAAEAADRLASESRDHSIGSLTRAEIRVAALVSDGLSTKAVAEMMGVGTRAVEKHLTNCYRKLGVDGRAALVTLMHAWSPGAGQGSSATG